MQTVHSMGTELKVFCATWNLYDQYPPLNNFNLGELFEKLPNDADFVAVGLQEVPVISLRDPWADSLRTFLSTRGFVHIECTWSARPRVRATHLFVFVHRRLFGAIYAVETLWHRLTLLKATIALRILFRAPFDCNFTFITSHLSPDQENYHLRVHEYNNSLSSLQFVPLTDNVISDGYVFWLGDLNFRVDSTDSELVIDSFQSDDCLTENKNNIFDNGVCVSHGLSKWLQHDQLLKARRNSEAFAEFREGPISFPPTYKFRLGSQDYDSHRIPSWCDRILWRSPDPLSTAMRCRQEWYGCVSKYTFTDHRAVVALFTALAPKLEQKPSWQKGNFLTFANEVHFEFPSKEGTDIWLQGNNNKCQFTVSSAYSWSNFDWIGLFEPTFKSDFDVVTWMYVSSSWEEAGKLNLLFKAKYIPATGVYQLGFYSRQRNCLLALSKPFKILPIDSVASVDQCVEAGEDAVLPC